ncbi:carboxylesterase/lipase family protein [Fulvimarina endophytica]|uniref:carboxylesterase/lipase family protein n=1 Tax=Fulvimarina endophytica TaxID=2293836 RepID=UPI001FDF406D|nr:carboxylesterase family protein [Fulvimarina endophytica]
MSGSVFVKAPCGLIEGRRRGRVKRFLGIPYAMPPIGQKRFGAPLRRETLPGCYRAVDFGPSAPQRKALPRPLAAIARFASETSEDCLNLHVFTPGRKGRRPVLVFIHGGGFFLGSGSQYAGDELAARGDIVVVSINYRLGLLGFNAFTELFGDDERFVANAGLLDQRMALEWVRDNIEAFGGDPERITIAGESAGAASVGYHLVTDGSKTLFSQAICQSGAVNMFHPRAKAVEISRAAFAMLCPGGNRETLFDLPAGQFVRAFSALSAMFPGIPTMPYVDGRELPDETLPQIYARVKSVPLLIGTNRDEFTLFVDLPGFSFPVGANDLLSWVERTGGAERAERVSGVYSADKSGSTAFGTDILFRSAAIRFAEVHSREAPTFMYRLDWRAKGLLQRLGATHSVDLPLIFDQFLRPFRSVYLGVLPDPARQRLALRMQDHWTHFVRTGRPGEDWPAYAPERRSTMIFGVSDRIEDDPDEPRRTAWEGLDGFVP